jgi:hypothetical protein
VPGVISRALFEFFVLQTCGGQAGIGGPPNYRRSISLNGVGIGFHTLAKPVAYCMGLCGIRKTEISVTLLSAKTRIDRMLEEHLQKSIDIETRNI